MFHHSTTISSPSLPHLVNVPRSTHLLQWHVLLPWLWKKGLKRCRIFKQNKQPQLERGETWASFKIHRFQILHKRFWVVLAHLGQAPNWSTRQHRDRFTEPLAAAESEPYLIGYQSPKQSSIHFRLSHVCSEISMLKICWHCKHSQTHVGMLVSLIMAKRQNSRVTDLYQLVRQVVYWHNWMQLVEIYLDFGIHAIFLPVNFRF